jgi:hypothetical protein
MKKVFWSMDLYSKGHDLFGHSLQHTGIGIKILFAQYEHGHKKTQYFA